ncbi:MAG: hypothetical protein V3W37_03655, partial [Candidatus Binatia bacterium]
RGKPSNEDMSPGMSSKKVSIVCEAKFKALRAKSLGASPICLVWNFGSESFSARAVTEMRVVQSNQVDWNQR